jgi:hypothetical protein
MWSLGPFSPSNVRLVGNADISSGRRLRRRREPLPELAAEMRCDVDSIDNMVAPSERSGDDERFEIFKDPDSGPWDPLRRQRGISAKQTLPYSFRLGTVGQQVQGKSESGAIRKLKRVGRSAHTLSRLRCRRANSSQSGLRQAWARGSPVFPIHYSSSFALLIIRAAALGMGSSSVMPAGVLQVHPGV